MTRVRGGVLAACIACAVAWPAAGTRAATAAPESLFVAGNAAYESGDYERAIECYTGVANDGIVDPDLYYNLGNAFFKSGDLGRAVLWYERARRLAPRDGDVRENLAVVSSLLRDQQLAPKRGGARNALLAWHHRLSASESALIASVFYLLFCGVAVCLVFRRSDPVARLYRKLSWASAGRLFGLEMAQDFLLAMVVALSLSAVFAGSAYAKIHDARERSRGVVVSEEAPVFSGPSHDATLQFKVHEGTVVWVRDARSGWVRIDLPGGLSGWVDATVVERI